MSTTTIPLICASCGKPISSTKLRGLCAACLVRGARSASGAKVSAPDEEEDTAGGALFRIPGHDVLEEIARGGMGIVYRARQHDPAREVAVKMLLPGGATAVLRERFRNEARTMAELNHPGVLPLYQFGEHGGTPWFTMKLAGGGSLAERLRNPADPLRTDPKRAAALMAEIAEAVAYAHERGVLHRDLKPGNILFDSNDRACVADFGLAKLDSQSVAGLTHSRTMLGTPHYLAPELAAKAGTSATVATDVYALGAILYELLAGHPPFQSESLAGLLRRIVEDDPPSLLTMKGTGSGIVPRGLAAIAGKAMAREPSRRYRDAGALAADLRSWLAGDEIVARPPGSWEKISRWVRRHPAWAASLAAVMAGIAAVIVLQAKAGGELRAERDVADTAKRLALDAKADALAAQVSAARIGRQIELRESALAAAREAAGLKVTPDLRDDAISLLAAPGWQVRETVESGPSDFVPLSPDHRCLVSLTAGVLTLQDLSGKTPPVVLPPLAKPVLTVTFVTADGAHVAVRTSDAAHHLYSRAENKWVREWAQSCWGFRPSPDGNRVAWCVTDTKEVVVENLYTGEVLYRIMSAKNQPCPVAFSPDGKRLAVAGWKEQGVDIIDLETATVKAALTTLMLDMGAPKVGWRPDGRGIALAMGAADLYVFTMEGNLTPVRERVIGHQAEVMDVSWHPSGRWFASCAFDGTVRVWESPSRREVLRVPVLASSVHFSADGSELACLAYSGGKLHRYGFIEPVVTAQCALPRDSPDYRLQRPSWGCALTPDGLLGVTVSAFGVHYFEASTGRVLGFQGGTIPSDFVFNAAGNRLFAVGADGVQSTFIKRLPLLGADVIVPDRPPETLSTARGYRAGWSEARQRLVWTSKDGVKVREMASGSERFLPGRPFPLNPCVLSPDGRWLASSGGDYSDPGLVIWNLDEPGPPLVIPGFGSYSYAAFSPDSKQLYVFTDDRLCALATGTWKTVWSNERTGLAKSQHQVALSGDGYLLAAVEPPDVVGLYEAATGRRLARLRYPDVRWVGWIALDYAGARLIATTLPDSVISWDLRRVRSELAKLGLDWDAPPYPPAPPARKMILRFTGSENNKEKDN